MAKKQAPAKKALKSAPKAPKAAKGKEKPSKLAAIKNLIMGAGKGAPKKAAPAAKAKPAPKAVVAKAVAVKGKPPIKAGAVKVAAPIKGVKTAPVKPVPAAKVAKGKTAAIAVLEKVPAGKKGKAAVVAAPIAAPILTKPQKMKRGRAGGGSVSRYDADNCREVACEGLSTTAGYCRMHYIKNWKKIKRKELILKEKKLNSYIEELVVKYPDKYIEAIRQDLANDKDFAKVIYDLDLDESVDDFDVEGESVEQVIDSIKRDFDDEGDAF